MAGCAYEGTSTLHGPERPIPENLVAAGDCIIYYPIDRSYAFDFSDGRSVTNRPYARALTSWLDRSPQLPIMLGEYYNVSKFEDLPLLFTSRILHDLPDYHRRGARAITYMHLPHLSWAVRTLTQGLYAQLAWDPGADGSRYVAEYLAGWYGPSGEAMMRAYELIERGWSHVAEWRAWHASFLDLLLKWDGARPEGPLEAKNELGTAARAIAEGRDAAGLLAEALEIIETAQARERERAAGTSTRSAAKYERRLGEDRRLVRYGLDTMRLMTATVSYHDALSRDDGSAAEAAWAEVERRAADMDAYWIPVDYEYPGPGLSCRDALSRTQLRELIARCRGARILRRGS